MKTLLTLAASLLLAISSWALPGLPPPATATFASERGQVFGLVLDGQPLTRPVARQVRVDRLVPGRHWADFSVPMSYGPPLRLRTSVWLEPGLETAYVLVLYPGTRPQLRQVAAAPLGRPGYGPQGGYGGGYPAPLPPAGPYGGGPGGYGRSDDGAPYPGDTPYGNNPGAYSPAPGPGPANPGGSYPPSGPAPGGLPYPGPGGSSGGYYPGGAPAGYLAPLSPADVQGLVQALSSQPFDDARLSIAKQALAQGTVRADELAQLISTLTFDKSRIDLAKYGYSHLNDPQNFYRVYDVLRFPSSIREVQQALGIPQN